MPSKITLTFSELPIINSTISFRYGEANPFLETFKSVRQESFQSKLISSGTFTQNLNETISLLRSSFNSDFNAAGDFTLTIVPNEESNPSEPELPDSLRIETDVDNFFTAQKFNASFNVDVTFENTATPITLKINNVDYQSSGNSNTVQGVITTSELAEKYSINGNPDVNVFGNPFTIPTLLRGSAFIIAVKKGTASSSSNIRTPDILVGSNFSSSYLNSPSGATISITNNYGGSSEYTFINTPLIFQYSLDGTNFQSSSVFSGILEGDYTIYIKDQFNAQVNIPITIPSFDTGGVGERLPYSDLPSKSNSIRYAKYVEWGVCSNYKNDENTLSWQLPYIQDACEYTQLFQECDNIITQIKTNYSNIIATVIDEDLVETIFPFTQKTFYTDLKNRRDAKIYNISNLGLQTGIYFDGVSNIYDYYSGALTSNLDLNGALPSWGVIGNFVFYNNAWFLISNIIYDDSVASYVLVIDSSYTGANQIVEVSSVYNLEPYNIFEFTLDMSLFNNKKIQVNITQTDNDVSFPDQIYLSEIINVSTSQEDTLCIDYYNENNTDIFYGTGIKNRIRMPIEFFGGTVIDETNSERTDINTYLISSEGYESDNIAFKLMPKQMMRKVVQALSHKFVFLNEVQYVKEESPEVTGFSGSNLYRINAPMTKSNAVYTSRGIGQEFITGSFEIPNLLKVESEGFLKIKK
tara:strand:- start:1028 stop:3112 length:2085 start_codon:yes stop_codon:yes gene_type:complete